MAIGPPLCVSGQDWVWGLEWKAEVRGLFLTLEEGQ